MDNPLLMVDLLIIIAAPFYLLYAIICTFKSSIPPRARCLPWLPVVWLTVLVLVSFTFPSTNRTADTIGGILFFGLPVLLLLAIVRLFPFYGIGLRVVSFSGVALAILTSFFGYVVITDALHSTENVKPVTLQNFTEIHLMGHQ